MKSFTGFSRLGRFGALFQQVRQQSTSLPTTAMHLLPSFSLSSKHQVLGSGRNWQHTSNTSKVLPPSILEVQASLTLHYSFIP